MQTSQKAPATVDQAALASAALKNFRIIFNSIKKHFRRVEDQCGISSSQLWLLWELHKTPGLKVSELAGRLAIHQSTASNLIDKVVRRGLICKKREDKDQRVVRLYLTEMGKELVQKAPESPRGVLTEAIERLPVDELLKLQNSLQILIEHMEITDKEDAMKPLTSR